MVSEKNFKSNKKNSIFLFILLLIDLFWLLGTKVSELLLDPLVAEFSGDINVITNQIQYYDSIFNFVVAFSVIIFGILVDRYPCKRKFILLGGNLIWIGINLIIYFSPINFTLYAIMQICWGIAIGANGPLIFSYLGDLFEINYRGRLFSLFALILYLIKGSSSIITGFIGEFFQSWKTPLLVMAIGEIITLFVYFFATKEPQLAQIEPEFKDKIAQGEKYQYRIVWKDIPLLIKQKTNSLFLLQGIFGMIGVTIVNRYLLYWLTSDQRDGLALGSSLATLLLALSGGIGALIGILLAGWWADRQFNRGRLDKMLHFSIVCIFCQVGMYALLVFVPKYPESINLTIQNPVEFFKAYPVFWQFALIFNFCLLMGTAVGPVVGTTRTHLNLPEHRGTIAALYDTVDFIGAGIALILGGIISEFTQSFRITLFLGALAWLISGLIWIGITRVINPDYQEIRKILQSRAKILEVQE